MLSRKCALSYEQMVIESLILAITSSPAAICKDILRSFKIKIQGQEVKILLCVSLPVYNFTVL